jgi:hypothetical protein
VPFARIVQLPFPSTEEPDPRFSDYYQDYDAVFRAEIPDYFVPQGDLWEMPLWVAHLTALLDTAGMDSTYIDLAKTAADADSCVSRLLAETRPADTVLFSPLAQNFGLAQEIAAALESAGRRVVLGGNMAPLMHEGTVSLIHRGQLDVDLVRKLAAGEEGLTKKPVKFGVSEDRITWAPDYRHLSGFSGRVPLLRLNASHGCLFDCSFCGDAWSRQLVLVDRDALECEVDSLTTMFPETRILYIGDKTFGQSREAVRNLIEVFRHRPGYRFIVQTHVAQVKDWVIDAMSELGAVVVELGFESADAQLLKRMNKLSHGLDDYTEKIGQLSAAGLKVVLNLMGGLPEETEQSHQETVNWLTRNREDLWLFNLYNFVPYPLVPDFPELRSRIVDWDFSHWREDAPVVYRPRHLTRERSWELFLEKISVAHGIVRDRAAAVLSPARPR